MKESIQKGNHKKIILKYLKDGFCLGAEMELRILQVKIKCIDDEPHVFISETEEELEVVYGNFEYAIFVKYMGDEYMVDIVYPCFEGGEGVLRLKC